MVTPEEWKVPHGRQAYVVTAVNNEGAINKSLIAIAPDKPGELGHVLFTKFPETVDYTFRQIERSEVHAIGREYARREFVGQAITAFIFAEELKS